MIDYRKARRALGIAHQGRAYTQAEFAALLGLDRRELSVRRWEAGTSAFRDEQIGEIL